ncbi:MAG: hypothetical protein LBD23_20565, partial [Oscillospiraceae bacterium]|nr:hypothetical protein [Oscillospiraceae bacterium]
MKIKSLGLKVSLIVVVIIAAIITINTIVVSTQSTDMMLMLTERESAAANASLNTEVQRLQDEAQARARIIAYSNNVIDAILNDDAAALRDILIYYSEGFDVITL